ncbi:MAG: hypothetical protein CMP07_04245 [Xanthomonadales bacterium]|nr:hypothetical protein [Xanthomonadales bacterium]|tara:strand:+ start:978 stop:1442 length:465 start_codon:yes stop_codon:yes gene_type:complete
MKAPLLIEAELLGSADDPGRARWLPLVSDLKQVERPLVLVAARPDRWTPTRNRVDRAFMRQADIEAEVRRAGGALDAIIYLDVGLFGRKRQYQRNMADVANRYDCKLENIHAIVKPGKIADALEGVIGSLERIDGQAQFRTALENLLKEYRAAK